MTKQFVISLVKQVSYVFIIAFAFIPIYFIERLARGDMKRACFNFFILLLLSSCEGCKIDEPKPKTELEKLPPATQEGKNTFGCLVNGKAYVPIGIDAGAVYQLGILQIYGLLNTPSRELTIVLRENNNQLETKTYSLTDFPARSATAYVGKPPAIIGCVYDYPATYMGSVTITKIDRVKYIISGVFEFSTALAGCDTLKITNGRFDLEYIP
jgi:hypothetical protein